MTHYCPAQTFAGRYYIDPEPPAYCDAEVENEGDYCPLHEEEEDDDPWGGRLMNTKTNRPEAWHARALHDYAEQLTIAVRMLEHLEGYRNGVAEARVAA